MDDSTIMSGEERERLKDELEKWHSGERFAFVAECLKSLPFAQIKLMSLICSDLINKKINASAISTPSSDQYSTILEEQANDITYFQILNQKSIEKKLQMLISYVPLLKSHNFNQGEKLKRVYFNLISEIFSECVKLSRSDLLLECYELSLIAYLHPAFDDSQQSAFRKWQSLFESFLLKLIEQKKAAAHNATLNQQLTSTNQIEKINAAPKQSNVFNNFQGGNDKLQAGQNKLSLSIKNLNDSFKRQQSFAHDTELPKFDKLNESLNSKRINPMPSHSSESTGSEATSQPDESKLDEEKSCLNKSLIRHVSESNKSEFADEGNFSLINDYSSLSPALHEQSSQSKFIQKNNEQTNNSLPSQELNSNDSVYTEVFKKPPARPHLPLKASISLPYNTSNSNNKNYYGFNSSLKHYDSNSFSNLNSMNSLMGSNYSIKNYAFPSNLSSSHFAFSQSDLNNSQTNHFTNKPTRIDESMKNLDPFAKNLAQWLKSLRLHKYTETFIKTSYDELIGLNDEKLMELNITLGARKKMLNHIEKLKERSIRLKEFIDQIEDEKNPINNTTMQTILIEVTEIAASPMKPKNGPPTSISSVNLIAVKEPAIDSIKPDESDPETLSALFVLILNKIQKYLLKELNNQKSTDLAENEDTNESKVGANELALLFTKIIDKLFVAKAFTDVQNTQLSKLRNSISEKIDKTEYKANRKPQMINNYGNLNFAYYDEACNNMAASEAYFAEAKNSNFDMSKRVSSAAHFEDEMSFQLRPRNFNSNLNGSQSFNANAKNLDSTHNLMNARQRIQQKNFKEALSKTVSAPYNPNPSQD